MRFCIGLALGLGAIGACTLLDDAPPDDSCRVDDDCFRAQGEFCNQTKKRCEVRVFSDAGIDTP